MTEPAVLLDTNVFSYLGKSGDKRSEIYRPHTDGKIICVSFVTVGELYFGAKKGNWNKAKWDSLNVRLKSTVIIPYDIAICDSYAKLKAGLGKGRTIADNDLWIAACALRHSIPLITHNRKHFLDFRDLILISENNVVSEIESQTVLPLVTTQADPHPVGSSTGTTPPFLRSPAVPRK